METWFNLRLKFGFSAFCSESTKTYIGTGTIFLIFFRIFFSLPRALASALIFMPIKAAILLRGLSIKISSSLWLGHKVQHIVHIITCVIHEVQVTHFIVMSVAYDNRLIGRHSVVLTPVIGVFRHADKHADNQVDKRRQTCRQSGRQSGRQTYRQTCRQSGRQTYRQTMQTGSKAKTKRGI